MSDTQTQLLFDSHVHVWPDKIADKALAGRVDFMEAGFDGKVSGLEKTLDRCGIQRTVVMGIADHARHVHRTNEFIGGLRSERMIPFGTVHPEVEVTESIESLRANNITGIKLHPLFQRFALDDERIWAVFEAIGDEFPVIAHIGKGGTPETDELATPAMVARIVDNFPKLRLISCHLGGFHRLDEAENEVIGKDCLIDTTWPPSIAELPKDRVLNLLRRHGTHRVVWGSDWPMSDPGAEVEAIRNLGLSDEEVEG
ncbi:MAG: amidohydrolase family protein, partial [Propionibacteriaceae bacterium]|nr:amidohydrolase family protein [Propionibacteriaceae bacterium]